MEGRPEDIDQDAWEASEQFMSQVDVGPLRKGLTLAYAYGIMHERDRVYRVEKLKQFQQTIENLKRKQ